ncbi:hypothetical protein [Francisella uliginis]|uniref:Chitin-binding type-3 domain-containing protein n=1 Tax=Francisella uliginis TaxID=573570 RepID=A0A1L4BQP1_9GAMM|nr:hypothetical protein [Francisella uliginis]API86159.1 hypothetical protein F7310_01785 [Francisella uliginis]
MSLIRKKYNGGVALVFAVSVAIVFMVMGFLLFALVRSDLFIQKSEKQNLEKKIQVQQAFKNGVISGSQFVYNENIIPSGSTESKTLSNNTQYIVEISNSDSSSGSTSFIIPESGYTMRTRGYYVKMSLIDRVKNAVIRVPSITLPSLDSSIDKSTISLNIPAINFNELSASQLNAEDTLTDKQVGYIGNLKVDGATHTLEFTSKNSAEPKTLSLSGFESGALTLSQGWVLKGGVWDLSIGVFNPDTEEGCVITSSLQNFLSNFTSLKCINLNKEEEEDIQGARYPNPQAYPTCIAGQRYSEGYICQEDGILFIANKNNADALPFENDGDWRVYYPDPQWVEPYTQGAKYSVGDLVVYDGRLYKNSKDGQMVHTFDNAKFKLDGIYPWSERIRYYPGNIVTYNGSFYQADKKTRNDPSDTKRWTNLGETYNGKSVDDYPLEKIVFPYRSEDPSQTLLNCKGEYPPIDTDTYQQCVDGDVYNEGDMCYENNMLFVAQYWTSGSPFKNPNAWRLYLPNSDWVVPFSYNVMYADQTTKVIFDNKRFINQWWVNAGKDPYEDSSWKIDGIYEWNKDITYLKGDIIILYDNFYKARWQTKDKNPLNNSGNSGAWENLGLTYQGKSAQEYLDACDSIVRSFIILKSSCYGFSCTVDIVQPSTTQLYTYEIYDQNGSLLGSTTGSSVDITFKTAGDHKVYAVAKNLAGVEAYKSNELDYTIESQLTKDPITYMDPTGYGSKYTDKLFSDSGLIVTATTDYITFNCPTGYSFIKGAEALKSRKSETYRTYDDSTYLMKGVRVFADKNTDSAGSVVYTGSSVMYQNNIKEKGSGGWFKHTNYLTRAICVPDNSDGHWDI